MDNVREIDGSMFDNDVSNSDEDLIDEESFKDDLNEDETKDREKLCFGCDSETDNFYMYDCGNGLCQECNREHIKAQLEKYKTKVFSQGIKFICPGSCKCLVEDNEKVVSSMSPTILDFYQEILLKMYINRTPDIITCPRSSCSFAGIIKPGCAEKYECNLCKYQWEEDNNCQSLNFYKMFKTLPETLSIINLKSYIKKFLITKYCNFCNSPIEKNEGCKHIECNRCEYSFCWKCTENWKVHQEIACMGLFSNEWEESFRPDFIPLLFIGIGIFFLLKFVFTFTLMITLLVYLIKIVIFGGMIFLNCFAVFFNTKKLMKGERTKAKFILKLLILVVIEFVLHYFNLHPFSEKWYYRFDFVSVFLTVVIGLMTKSIYN
jgi:hypothetical protein